MKSALLPFECVNEQIQVSVSIRNALVAAAKFAQVLLIAYAPAATADSGSAYLEFDNRMLWGAPQDKAGADLSRFSRGNPTPVGNIKVDLYLNNVFFKTTDVVFIAAVAEEPAAACFTASQLRAVGLIVEKLHKAAASWLASEQAPVCKHVSDVVPQALATFDFAEQRLNLSIAQAFLHERSASHIDPKTWDTGITAARFNYSIDLLNSQSEFYSKTQGFMHLDSGFNAYGWRARSISTLASAQEQHTVRVRRSYLQTDIAPLTSQLTVGQTYTQGQLFDSFGLQGVVLATDSRMLPAPMRNYAPLVKGHADTNATVTIRQNHTVIEERVIPPGPFEITTLTGLGYGSDLDVTVKEADGSVKQFRVPYYPSVQLLRPNLSKYDFSVGQAWSESYGRNRPPVVQLGYQRGVNNHVTTATGTTLSDDYTAGAMGVALSTFIGGISTQYAHSTSRYSGGFSAEGGSIRLGYSTLLKPTNTHLTLSSDVYADKEFVSFGEFIGRQRFYRPEDGHDLFLGSTHKRRTSVGLRQRLPSDYGGLYVSGSTREFWNREGRSKQYQASYSNQFKELTYDVSASRIADHRSNRRSEWRLSVSMPLRSSGAARHYLSATFWKPGEAGSVSQIQVGGTSGSEQQVSYVASTTQALEHSASGNNVAVNGGYQGPQAYVSAGMSKGDGYQQASLGVAGSLLAHADGFTLGQTLGDTIALVHAPDGEGARVATAPGSILDSAGYGVVSHLTPYSRNRVELDPQGLSPEVLFSDTDIEVVPVAGAIVRVAFATSKEPVFYFSGTFEDGSPLPFGAVVIDVASQNQIGYVGQAGRIFGRGVSELNPLEVKFKDGSCRTQKPVAKASAGHTVAGSERAGVVCKLI